jgi:hypothetical protein
MEKGKFEASFIGREMVETIKPDENASLLITRSVVLDSGWRRI